MLLRDEAFFVSIMKFQLSTLASLLLTSSIAYSTPASPSRPHVIFVLFDDQGYNEVNWVNGNDKKYVLPTLDSLAAEGVALESNYYVGPICSPSRSMLMTGRYTTRLGTHANVVFWDTPWAVPKEEEFLPQVIMSVHLKICYVSTIHLSFLT